MIRKIICGLFLLAGIAMTMCNTGRPTMPIQQPVNDCPVIQAYGDLKPIVFNVAHLDEPKVRVRLLILKATKEHMADVDADMAVTAAKQGSGKGLDIKTVGNHYFNKNGEWKVALTEFNYDLPAVKTLVSKWMKVEAQPGDTFMVFTIGHGMPDGGLQNLGQRVDVMKALAEAAEENNQRTFWWQLSCYASASLPSISSLTPKQQELFSMLASSDARTPSAAYVQGKIMEKMFVALATRDKDLDVNGDGTITQTELSAFLNKSHSLRVGDRLHAKSADYPIFGGVDMTDLANKIPIVDRNGPQSKYPKGYIPRPQ